MATTASRVPDLARTGQILGNARPAHRQLAASKVNRYALFAHVNIISFRSCLDTCKFKDAVKADAAVAEFLNISATPSFVIGRTTPEAVEGQIQLGAVGLERFQEEFEKSQQAFKSPGSNRPVNPDFRWGDFTAVAGGEATIDPSLDQKFWTPTASTSGDKGQ